VDTAIVELDSRPGDEVFHRLRDEHFVCGCLRADSRAGVNCNAANLRSGKLAFPGVEAS
jgi:hypothetical protein